jgi:prevent-host-death family protein
VNRVITVGVEEAQRHLSRLLRQVDEGDEVVIERDGRPVARLVRVEPRRRAFGQLAGRFQVPDDFDDPLADDLLDLFDGGPPLQRPS